MMDRIRIDEDNIFWWLVAGSLVLTVVLGAATALIISVKFGFSVVAGGLLATGNFFWLRRGVESLLRIRPNNAPQLAVVRLVVRLATLGLVLYVLIVHLHADIFGLLLGLSVLVFNIMAFSIYMSTRKGG
jgi:hypothetical protein